MTLLLQNVPHYKAPLCFSFNSDQQCLDSRNQLSLLSAMESKRPNVLQNLRHKIMLRRNKLSLSKTGDQLGQQMDRRMSCSVPDFISMKQDYSCVTDSPQIQQQNTSSRSSPSTPLIKSSKHTLKIGKGLKLKKGGAKNENRLSVPGDSTDGAVPQDSLNKNVDDRRSSDTSNRVVAGMEAEELALPEMISVYSPEAPSVDCSPDSQVWKLKTSRR